MNRLTREESNILKGFGILTVIITHTSDWCPQIYQYIPLFKHRIFCIAISRAGLPMFLFLSGYGLYMSYSKKGFKNYWRSKILAVMVPYVLVQGVTMLIDLFRKGNSYSLLFNLSQITGINATNVYDSTMWYISYIMFWYFVFWLSFMIGKDSFLSFIIMGIIAAAGFLYVPFYWGNNGNYCVLTFFLGACAAKLPELKLKKALMCLLGFVLTFIAYITLVRHPYYTLATENIGSFAAVMASVIFIKLIAEKYKFYLFGLLGTVSFWLYLLEMKLIIKNDLYDIWGCTQLTYWGCFIGTVFIAYVLNRLYDAIKPRILKVIGKIMGKAYNGKNTD